jgi:hypothetical protein
MSRGPSSTRSVGVFTRRVALLATVVVTLGSLAGTETSAEAATRKVIRKKVTKVIRTKVKKIAAPTSAVTLPPVTTLAPPPPTTLAPPPPVPTTAAPTTVSTAPPPVSTVARALSVTVDGAAVPVVPGNTAVIGVVLRRIGFSGPVTISVTGLPAGASGTFSPNPTDDSTNLYVSTTSSIVPGEYALTITATAGNVVGTTNATLSVKKPVISISLGTIALLTPGTTTQFDVVATATPSSTATAPEVIVGTPEPGVNLSSVTPTATGARVVFSVPATTRSGFYLIPISANKDGVYANTAAVVPVNAGGTLYSLPLVVVPAAVAGQAKGFTLAASVSTLSIAAGSPGNVGLTIATTGGYSDTLQMLVGVPPGFTVAPAGTGTNTLNLVVNVPVGTAAGSYPVKVFVRGEAGIAAVTVSVTVP